MNTAEDEAFHTDEADKREKGMANDSSWGPKTRNVHRFSRGLMLGIAFGSTAGGIATLNGSPAHLVLSGSSILDGTLTYSEWLLFGFPISACTFLLAYIVLYCMYARMAELPVTPDVVQAEREKLYREVG